MLLRTCRGAAALSGTLTAVALLLASPLLAAQPESEPNLAPEAEASGAGAQDAAEGSDADEPVAEEEPAESEDTGLPGADEPASGRREPRTRRKAEAKNRKGSAADEPATSEQSAGDEPRAAEAEEEEEQSQYTGPPTLLDDGPIALGGYGGINVSYTRVLDSHGVMVGGEGAFLIDHQLAVGGGGYGLVNLVRAPDAPDGTRNRLHFGYGGVILRYHFLTNYLVYLSAATLIGAGGITFTDYHGVDWEEEDRDANGFFVIEPQLGAHMNITRWMRVGLNASYRFVNGVDIRGLRDADLRGPSFGSHVQFGWL